jgi:hypothetical protein
MRHTPGVSFVPDDAVIPLGLTTELFRLEPLGSQHNDADRAAWMSSIPHIQATPGFVGRSWPPDDGMPAEANNRDLVGHAADFAARRGFTYTVLDPESDEIIGCVYLYPAKREGYDVHVLSWVTAARAELDAPLAETLLAWLDTDWPFTRPDAAAR